MSTTIPEPETPLLTPPDAAETLIIARGVASASAPDDGLTPLQAALIEAISDAMTGHQVDASSLAPISAEEYAAALARRNRDFRTRMVHFMLLGALVLRPLPGAVVERVRSYAGALGVDDDMLSVAQRFSSGALGLAALDFQRNGYTSTWHPSDAGALHTSRELESAWESAVADPALAAQWSALEDLPPGTLGRRVWELYRARGFEFPGRPGSAPPLLAQHDWVHVLADYGTTVENELEAFAFIARANDDPHGFSLLAMVISLFETGYLRADAGLFEYDTGHLSTDPRVVVRLADAMRRGALCSDERRDDDSVDFLRLDWFELAPLDLAEVRRMLHVVAKSDAAVRAGSIGPWEPGGMSPFQHAAGMAMAERETRVYDSHGACTQGDP
ncbi:MAG TPA: hypothetical protein VIH82_12575 [Acidimicrobiia bacterium]